MENLQPPSVNCASDKNGDGQSVALPAIFQLFRSVLLMYCLSSPFLQCPPCFEDSLVELVIFVVLHDDPPECFPDFPE